MAQKVVYFLLVTLILSLGFGQLLRFDLYGLPIYLHDFLVIAILILQGLALKVKIPPSLRLFFISLGISSLYALTLYPLSSLLIPSLYMFRLLAYLSLFLLLQNSKIIIPKTIFLISGFTMVAIGLMQYFLLPDMRIFQHLGWDDHLSRLTLPHFDPTFTGAMLGLFLFTLNRSQWFIASMVVLSAMFTYSRSVWLSLLFTAMAFVKPRLYLLLIPVFLATVLLLPKRFGEGTNLLRTYSITSRFDYDKAFVVHYKWDLLIGRGMNTNILDRVCIESSCDSNSHATGPNSSYLYLLTTTGILGLVGWGMFMYSLYSGSRHKPMLVFFFIASLFNNVMFYPFALLWVLLLETDIVS